MKLGDYQKEIKFAIRDCNGTTIKEFCSLKDILYELVVRHGITTIRLNISKHALEVRFGTIKVNQSLASFEREVWSAARYAFVEKQYCSEYDCIKLSIYNTLATKPLL